MDSAEQTFGFGPFQVVVVVVLVVVMGSGGVVWCGDVWSLRGKWQLVP